ncbi:CHAT domain-containing tetratricopeptide repeat protein [uncultured Kordia sp.]|uniref:CHAT domain-containing protein n=1 Tax=uncultured Kordia sp. TaxID=507699 RepID=UPI00261BAC8A|nr:CHAT domain-containing tetratricopeptide repeat protein [uncultured Kordia sp.]
MKKIIYFVYAFLLLGTLTSVYAQEKDTTIKGYLAKGEQLLFYGKYNEATLTFQEALKLSKSANNYTYIAASYNGLSKVCNYNSQLEEAFQYAKEAFFFSEKDKALGKQSRANALDNLAIVQGKMNNTEETLKNHREALQIRLDYFKDDKLQLARSYFNVGVAFHKNRKLQEASQQFDKALAIGLEETPQKNILHADIYESKGYLQYDLGRIDKAFSFFQKTNDLAQKTYKNDHPYFGKVYNDLGLIYSIKEEFNESLEYYNKALSVSIQNHGIDNHDEQVRIHFNIGTVYNKKGNKEKALFHTHKTLELGTKFYGVNHPKMYFPYSQLGNIYEDERGIPYLEKALQICLSAPKVNYVILSYQYEYHANLYQKIGKYEEAIKFFKKSLAIRHKINGLQNTSTIRTYINIAKVYTKMKDFENALLFNEKAIVNNRLPKFNEDNRFLTTSYVDSDLPFETAKTKADILLLLFEQTEKPAYLIESNTLYKEAISYINLVRKSKQNRQDKIVFSEIVKTIYAKNIQTTEMLLALENTSVSLEHSFYSSEKSKAHVLRELLKNAEAKRNSNLHPAILTLEKSINDKLAALQSKILIEATQKETDSIKLYALEGDFFDVSKRKDSLEKAIEVEFPKYYALKYKDSIIQLETLQKKLNDNTTLLEFFKSKNLLYTFIISKNAFHVKELKIDSLDAKIEKFNTAIVSKDQEKFTQNALYLYKQLVTPIEKHFVGNELIIIPDESLWHLQFDLLLTKDSENKEKPAYLLYDYAISYANSASLLFEETEKKTSTTLQNDCIAFSYTSKDSIQEDKEVMRLSDLRNANIDLPGTRKEIKEISKILEGSYFYGNNANETNFKKQADKFKIIHLALHGDIDNQNSNNLKIYFSEGSTNEDDKLFGHELYNLHIPASLVVLSACNTGNGQINKAEGIQSLGNAFQYAGAKSLLLSRWEISDKTTPDFMRYFYKHIKAGLPKHKALQQAKIDFLLKADTFNAAPFYWGSFYILGNTEAISFTTFNYTNWIIGILLFTLLFIFIFKRKQ